MDTKTRSFFKTVIDDQQGQIIITMQQVSTSGVNVGWLFIVRHSEYETAGAVERERDRES